MNYASYNDGRFLHAGKVIWNLDTSLIDCNLCGFSHLAKTPKDIDKYYTDDRFYQTHSPAGWLQKEIGEYRQGLWNAAYAHQTSLFYKGFPLLDVGCSTGTYLEYWRTANRSISWGIEPSEQARRFSSVQSRILPDFKTFKNSYRSVWPNFNVRMSLVLEHIPNPVEFLKPYVDLLGDGNLMVIVPNEFNPLQKRVGGDWFVSKVHVNYFTPESLRTVFDKAGLNVVYESATFPTELFILMGLDHRGNDALGRKLHRFRLRIENFAPKIFNVYQTLYNRFQWGRELVFVGVKKNA